jgi:TctA family transporter
VDLFDGLLQAFQSMQSWAFLIAFLLGCLNGVIFGMLPGLSGSVGIALMIPFSYGMGPEQAMALFVAALAGQTFAGSVAAILLNTPGTSPNAATTFDGYPLARQGRGGFAIGISATASLLGSFVGVAVLIVLFPAMRSIILAFSFPEFTMLGVLGLTAIAVASRGSMVKGLIAGLLGLLISFVGFAPIGGDIRYVFDQPTLFDGIGIVPVLIGLFAITEALRLLMANESVARDVKHLRFGRSQVWEGVVYTLKQPFLVLRSAMLGTAIGIVPAVGGTLASFLAYFQASKTVKDPKFGQGDPRGVLAPEAANNAKDSGAALPTLAFGIPGSADWAIILGAMVIHGITPGPNLMREHPDVVWVAILVVFGGALVSSVLGLAAAPWLIQVTRVRSSLLAPIVVVLAVTGAFGIALQMVDVLFAVTFGLLGYAMRQVAMPVVPLILGLILGPMVERSFLQTLSTYGGVGGFVTRPISLTLVLLAVAIIAYEVFTARRNSKRHADEVVEGIRTAAAPASLGLVAGIGAVGAVGLLLARDFSDQSRLFPSVTAVLLLGVVTLYLLIALVSPLRAKLGPIIADGVGLEQMGSSSGGGHSAGDGDETAVGGRRAGNGVEAAVGPGGPTARERIDGGTAGHSAATQLEIDEQAAPDDASASRRRLAVSAGLLVALAVATPLVGLALAVSVVLPSFFLFVGRETWRMTAVLSTATLVLLYVVFGMLLGVPIEGGSLLVY